MRKVLLYEHLFRVTSHLGLPRTELFLEMQDLQCKTQKSSRDPGTVAHPICTSFLLNGFHFSYSTDNLTF